jgi:hypothetical protein
VAHGLVRAAAGVARMTPDLVPRLVAAGSPVAEDRRPEQDLVGVVRVEAVRRQCVAAGYHALDLVSRQRQSSPSPKAGLGFDSGVGRTDMSVVEDWSRLASRRGMCPFLGADTRSAVTVVAVDRSHRGLAVAAHLARVYEMEEQVMRQDMADVVDCASAEVVMGSRHSVAVRLVCNIAGLGTLVEVHHRCSHTVADLACHIVALTVPWTFLASLRNHAWL